MVVTAENQNRNVDQIKLLIPQFERLRPVPGDFATVYLEYMNLVFSQLDTNHLQLPVVEPELCNRQWHVEQRYISSTGDVGKIEPLGKSAPEKVVYKVLRPPGEGSVLWGNAPHYLFPWSLQGAGETYPGLGVVYQWASILGEMAAGIGFNIKVWPYLGIGGIRDDGNGLVELLPSGRISARGQIWPALLMEPVESQFNLADMMMNREEWDEFDDNDWQYLTTYPLQVLIERSLPLPPALLGKYGSLEFVENSMVFETPTQAVEMGAWENADEVVREAAGHARYTRQAMYEYIRHYPDFIREVIGPGVSGNHADTKLRNILVIAENRNEVVAMVKQRRLEFVILDAQVLPLNEGMLVKSGTEGRERMDGINFAPWNYAHEGLLAGYGAMLWLALGRRDMYDKVVDSLLRERYRNFSLREAQLFTAWVMLLTAHKMGTVEPFVQASNWLKAKSNGGSIDPYLKLTMKKFPQAAEELAREALEIVGLEKSL